MSNTTESEVTLETSTKTEQQIREEILKELKLDKVEPQKPEIVNEYKSKFEKPRRIIFEIKGVVTDDAMYDGSYIAGKAVGISGYKLTSTLVNRNLSGNKEEDNFVTGFEVEEIYMSSIPEDIKQQRIKDVRIARAWLEQKYHTSLSKDNSKFWGDYIVNIDDLGEVYDTDRKGTTKQNDPLLMYYTILGGGHPDIALSNDQAKADNKFYYITIQEDEANRKFSSNMDRINATSALKNVMDTWSTTDILSLCYYLLNADRGFTLSTPRNILVQELSDFIEAVNFKTDKKKKPSEFIEAVKMFDTDSDVIRTQALFNAALYFGFVIGTKDKEFVNRETDFQYGTTKAGAVSKLLNPRHIEELSNIKKRVLDKWRL